MACVPVKEVTWPQPPLVLFSSSWVPESVIVPVAAMWMMFSPLVLSAWVMQYRRSLELPDPLPASPRLLTVHVVESCAAALQRHDRRPQQPISPRGVPFSPDPLLVLHTDVIHDMSLHWW